MEDQGKQGQGYDYVNYKLQGPFGWIVSLAVFGDFFLITKQQTNKRNCLFRFTVAKAV